MRRPLGLIAINLIVLTGMLEIAGAALHYRDKRGFIYLKPPFTDPRGVAIANRWGTTGSCRPWLHPYLGFACAPGLQAKIFRPLHRSGPVFTNNFGGLQIEPMSLPFPTGDDYVVAIFGGSVASNLVVTPRGGKSLQDALRAMPGFRQRRVVVINLAQGGGKQPQQLIALSLLLALGQHIDFVLNVDGFNEFALPLENRDYNVDSAMPTVQIMFPLGYEISTVMAGAEYLSEAYKMAALRADHERELTALDATRFGIGYIYHRLRAAWLAFLITGDQSDYEAAVSMARNWKNLKTVLGIEASFMPAPSADSLFDLWLRSSRQMNALAQAAGASYLHVIQPNQYHSRHRFSEAERNVALSLPATHVYRLGAEQGYGLFQARRDLLSAHGIVNAADIFDHIDDQVYTDNCCHYTERGETVFADFLAEQIHERAALDH